MKTAHVYISGFVQGVGYRQFVKQNAKRLGINGWVCNTPDGRVEAMFQGDEKNVQELIKECKKGPFLSEVENVEVIWEEAPERIESFDIV